GNQVGAVTKAAFDRPRRQWPGHIDAGCTQCTEQGKFLLAAGVVPAAEPIAIAHQFAEQTTAAVMAQRRVTAVAADKPGGTAATGPGQTPGRRGRPTIAGRTRSLLGQTVAGVA